MAANTGEAQLSDQQILELTNQIKAEHAEKQPLVGPLEPISNLQREYEQGSDVFSRKINWLAANGFKSVRRLRGDGECFYRAVGFALVESLVAKGSSVCQNFLERLQEKDLQIYSFADKDIVDDFSEPFKSLLQKSPSAEKIHQKFNDYETSNSAVVYLRLLASAQLRLDADEYFPFLFAYEEDARIVDPQTGMPSMTQFCSHYVEATGRDADHLAIQALTKALGLEMRVAYLDQSNTEESGKSGREGMSAVDFVSFDGGPFKFQGDSVLLLRPGHYDILS